MKKIYLITGADGYLGNNIVRLLQNEPDTEIRALILPGSSLEALYGLNVSLFYGNITEKESMTDFFEGLEGNEAFLIHCAGIVDIKSEYDPNVYYVNVLGTKNMAELAAEHGIRMVYISSVHAIPPKAHHELIRATDQYNPDNVIGLYAKTKAEASRIVTDMVQNKGLDAVLIQPSGLIGPYAYGRENMIQFFVETANGTLPATVDVGYNFVDVRDVASGIISACTKGRKGTSYILANKTISMKDLGDLISAANHSRPVKYTVPIWLVKLVTPETSLYYRLTDKEPLYTKFALETVGSDSNFDIEPAKKDLGFAPRPIWDTVVDTVAFLKSIFRIDPNRVTGQNSDISENTGKPELDNQAAAAK